MSGQLRVTLSLLYIQNATQVGHRNCFIMWRWFVLLVESLGGWMAYIWCMNPAGHESYLIIGYYWWRLVAWNFHTQWIRYICLFGSPLLSSNHPLTSPTHQDNTPFNSRAGCFLENCMYQHICSLCRAKGHNRLTECAALTTMAEKVLEKGIIPLADLYRESLPTKKYVSNKAVWLIMGMPFVIMTVESSGKHQAICHG